MGRGAIAILVLLGILTTLFLIERAIWPPEQRMEIE